MERPIYADMQTGITHAYGVGENVRLIGSAAIEAEGKGIVDVAKIASIYSDPNNQVVAVLNLYKNGDSTTEGGVGEFVTTRAVPMDGNVEPMPYYTRSVHLDQLKKEVNRLACHSNIWGCSSCDPTGKLFLPSEYSANKEDVLKGITRVEGGVGNIRYTTFTCPDQVSRKGEAITESNPSCGQVIIATTHKDGDTNRYSIVSAPTERTFQEAYLAAYGLPINQTYLQSVPWSQIPDYQKLLNDMSNQRIVCEDVDATWLYHNIEKMLQMGYTASGQ